jgi:hypothetical protein
MNALASTILQRVTASELTVLMFIHNLLSKKILSKFVGAYLLIYIYKYRNTALGVKPRKDLKSPGSWPLIGDIIPMTLLPKTQFSQLNEQFHKDLGSVFTVTLPFLGRMIDFTDPAILEHVLKTNFWAYEKGTSMHKAFFVLFGNGIFGADGHVCVFL